jgi:hypothetical protein
MKLTKQKKKCELYVHYYTYIYDAAKQGLSISRAPINQNSKKWLLFSEVVLQVIWQDFVNIQTLLAQSTFFFVKNLFHTILTWLIESFWTSNTALALKTDSNIE